MLMLHRLNKNGRDMKQRIIKSISVIFFLSILAKIIAFVKSIIQASYFGATVETDAYNMANGLVSNILFMLTTAIAVAFVPLYIQKKQQPKKAFKFSTRVITTLSILAVFITVLMEICAPFIIRLTVPAYEGKVFQDTVAYFRFLLLGFVFSFTAGIYQNILNAEKVYGYANFSSIVNSAVLIVITVLASERLGVWALVISVPVSYLCQFIMVYAKGKKYGGISLRFGLKDEAIRTLLILAMPIFLSQATVEINQIVDRMLLASVGGGAVTTVSYAVILYQFATHVINIPISTVMFTELSEAGAEKDYDRIRELLKDIYRIIFLICLPIVVIVSFTSSEIVIIVYGRGKFDEQAISQTAVGLLGYIYCLAPVVIKNVLTRAYYGLGDTKRPMVMSMLEVALNITLSVLLGKRFGIIGIVGATAIASLVFIVVMLVDFERAYFRVLYWNDIAGYWKEVVGVVAVIIWMWLMKDQLIMNVYIDFAVKSMTAFMIYFVVLLVVKESKVIDVLEWMKGKLKNYRG